MDRIDAMRAFAVAVDRGSLAASARASGQSPATISRAVAMLERRLGLRLLHRSTRALRLTQFGETYLSTCRDVLAVLEMAERGAQAEQELPSGMLSVTAPLMFGQLHLRPILDAFLDANTAVRARLLLLDRVVNIVDEGVDLAVRIGHLVESTLLATRVGEVRRVLCASPAYLERRGRPEVPNALREHDCIMERDGADTELWRFAPAPGKPLRPVAIRPRLVVNSASAAVDSAVGGHGIARVMSYQAAAAVAQGKLIVLLPKHEPPRLPVHIVMASSRTKTAKQKAFLEFAIPRLRRALTSAAGDMR